MENVKESLYTLLGLRPDATQDEIHEACFRLGELYRPDRNPGDPYSAKKFAAVEAAYAVLSDPVRRAAYD